MTFDIQQYLASILVKLVLLKLKLLIEYFYTFFVNKFSNITSEK